MQATRTQNDSSRRQLYQWESIGRVTRGSEVEVYWTNGDVTVEPWSEFWGQAVDRYAEHEWTTVHTRDSRSVTVQWAAQDKTIEPLNPYWSMQLNICRRRRLYTKLTSPLGVFFAVL